MKKTGRMIIMVLSICAAFTACQNNGEIIENNNQSQEINNAQNQQNSLQKEENRIREDYDVKEEMTGVIERTRLQTSNILGDEEKVSKIDFSDLQGVTYEHVEEITENEITEVWLVKMSNINQKEKIINKIKQSLEELKTKFADNKRIIAILENEDNIIIKEKEGIVIAAFAADAGAIVSGVEHSFTEPPKIIIEEEMKENVTEKNISGENLEEGGAQ